MKKTIYHGSDHIIKAPEYCGGKAYNDYGRGFYCTEDLSMAKEWGVRTTSDGFANKYNLDCAGLSVLDLNGEDYCLLHWLAILLENRTFAMLGGLAQEGKKYLTSRFHLPYEKFDIIQGYRADDSYFSFAQDFLNGSISYRQLASAMHLGKLGQQFVLKSPEAFARLEFQGFEPAPRSEWLQRKLDRDRAARAANPETNLKRLRKRVGMTQAALADTCGISVRTVQQYEQRKKDLNKAAAETVFQMARVLHCQPEALLEKV